jgi:lethal(3)malignant brain tumor-like protein
MKLEADDVKNSGRICVATVMDVLENRILVHFDGWDRKYDYWAEISSPNIHPVDWHKKHNFDLVPPPGEYEKSSFNLVF